MNNKNNNKEQAKSCDNCGCFSGSGHPKFFCGYYAEVPLDINLCKNWIPIKADKVEEEK